MDSPSRTFQKWNVRLRHGTVVQTSMLSARSDAHLTGLPSLPRTYTYTTWPTPVSEVPPPPSPSLNPVWRCLCCVTCVSHFRDA